MLATLFVCCCYPGDREILTSSHPGKQTAAMKACIIDGFASRAYAPMLRRSPACCVTVMKLLRAPSSPSPRTLPFHQSSHAPRDRNFLALSFARLPT